MLTIKREIKRETGNQNITLLFYTDPEEELTLRRWAKWERNVINDAGYGTGISGIHRKITTIYSAIANDDKDTALKELSNSLLSLEAIRESINHKGVALASLLKRISINDRIQEITDDLSRDQLSETSKIFEETDLTKAELDDIFEEVKKNYQLSSESIVNI